MSVHHQVSLNAMETIEAKMAFERQAFTTGIQVKAYHTDNGIYTSKDFTAELYKSGQSITHSGVGGHHHNGVAENAIKIVTRMARTMMIHCALRWPEVAEKELWPLALSYAVHIYNHTPRQETMLCPIEVWSKTKSSHSVLKCAQPWGCPTYVLDPKLQDGNKIPKWQPRSRRGQFVGFSPIHASTVPLVRNLRTGNLSPQFHVVHDSYFETATSDPNEVPKVWTELITFQTYRSDYDPEYAPPLGPEWSDEPEKQSASGTPSHDKPGALPPVEPVPPEPPDLNELPAPPAPVPAERSAPPPTPSEHVAR